MDDSGAPWKGENADQGTRKCRGSGDIYGGEKKEQICTRDDRLDRQCITQQFRLPTRIFTRSSILILYSGLYSNGQHLALHNMHACIHVPEVNPGIHLITIRA